MSDTQTYSLSALASMTKGRMPQRFGVQTALPVIGAAEMSGQEPQLFTKSYKATDILERNDVVMLWDGERSGLVSTGHYGLVGSTAARLHPNEELVDPKYLFYKLQYSFDWIQRQRTGTGVPHVPADIGKRLLLRILCDKNEQRRIAELLSAVDEHIAASQARAAKLRETKAALADKLLRTDATGSPYPVLSLSRVIERLESGVSVNAEDRPVTNSAERGVLKTSCVLGGAFLAHENKTIVQSDISRARVSPKRGCIIISRMNTPDLVGECGLVEADYASLYLPDRLWQAHPVSADTSFAWLNECLQWGPVRKRVRDVATGTSNSMKNISKSAFLAIEVPVPPPDAQQSIAGALNALGQAMASEVHCVRKLTKLKQGLAFNLLGGTERAK